MIIIELPWQTKPLGIERIGSNRVSWLVIVP
jgi:hypothetical protein